MLLLSSAYVAIMAIYSDMAMFVYIAPRIYSSYRFQTSGNEIPTILLASVITVLEFMALLLVTHVMDFPRMAVFRFWLRSSIVAIGKRIMNRVILRHYHKLGYNQKLVLLVGLQAAGKAVII